MSCSERPLVTEQPSATGKQWRTSLGQAKMLGEGSTLMGKLPGPSRRGCTHREAPTLKLLCLEFCYSACLSPLQSERCTDPSNHFAQPPHLQKTEVRPRDIGQEPRALSPAEGSVPHEAWLQVPHMPPYLPTCTIRNPKTQCEANTRPSPARTSPTALLVGFRTLSSSGHICGHCFPLHLRPKFPASGLGRVNNQK